MPSPQGSNQGSLTREGSLFNHLFVMPKSAKSWLISSKSMGQSIPTTLSNPHLPILSKEISRQARQALPTMQRQLVSLLPIQFLRSNPQSTWQKKSFPATKKPTDRLTDLLTLATSPLSTASRNFFSSTVRTPMERWGRAPRSPSIMPWMLWLCNHETLRQ